MYRLGLHPELDLVVRLHGSILPGIVATSLNAQDPTQEGEGILLPPPLDQRIPADPSSANSVAAFF